MGIISDIQQLIRGFLWCNGEYRRCKAKVSSDDICLLKRVGGLGLRSLEVFNLALMTNYIWNIVSNKESLWVRWIHTYKLRGRTLWDIRTKADMSWGWHKILQLRDLVKPFFWVLIGNGLKVSLWYDMWCPHCPLSRFLSPRDITREGYNLQAYVADLILNGAWNWPQAWLIKALNFGLIAALNLDASSQDIMRWLAGFEHVPPILEDIMMCFHPMAAKRMFKNVVAKLLFLASSYYIWLERNNRLFKNTRRSPEELRDLIMVTVRLKLVTFRFKNTSRVQSLLSLWKMPSNFRLYGC
ncbi:hypothetical protein Tco_1286219 [Tanacetum coccineum]